MAYSAIVGSFNIDTAQTVGQTQAITGLGFQPKIILFWWSGSTATADEVAGGNINIGFGAAISSTSRFCVISISDDAAATTNTGRGQYATDCIRVYSAGTPTLDGVMDFSSQDADGFTLIVDDQFSIAARISYLAMGGTDLTNVFIGNQAEPTSTGNYSVTGVGFLPDAFLSSTSFLTSASSVTTASQFALGMATSASAQGLIHGNADDAAATSTTSGYGYNGECVGRGTGFREALVSFDADGFTLNHLEGATGIYYHYICLKGGKYLVGDITTRTDGNDIAETVGFQPTAILFASANRALSTQDTPTEHNRISIGAATSTSNRSAQAISDEHNLADTETAHANYDSAVYLNVVDDVIAGAMDIKSIDASGFTCVMDDTDPAGRWVTYLAIGAYVATPMTLTGAVTQAGTITKGIGQTKNGALTPSGTLVRVLNLVRALAGGMTPSGTLAKILNAARTYAGGITPSGTLVRVLNFVRTLTGAVAQAGTLSKQLVRTVTGAVAMAGVMSRSLNLVRTLTGAVASAGTITKRLARSFAGAVASAGTYLLTIVTTAITPTSRTHTITAEVRTTSVIIESRTTSITAEDRTETIT